ncbi:MAG: Hpt domain-containing protein [Lachnospiraceae bacterium]|nr:Hpt domain-containing protein [Lachnospiraceae bacterium]
MKIYDAFEPYLPDYIVIDKRFDGMVDIWEKYVIRFGTENCFDELKEALKMGKYPEATSLAHRLKGDALNLAFHTYADVIDELLNVLKSNDKSGLKEKFLEVEKMHNELQEIYMKLQ